MKSAEFMVPSKVIQNIAPRMLMADAEELLRAAAPGSDPWALGIRAYHEGLLLAGRIGEVLASIARLSEIEPEPGAVGQLALTYLAPPYLALSGSWWGIEAWALMTIAYFPATRFYRVSPLWAPALPAIAIFYMGATIQSAASPILESVDLTDVYTGRPLPEGVKSLTLTFTFRSPERTLTDEEVNTALARFRSALETACGATFPA